MKGWLFLVIAIVGEVIATFALKSSEGFTACPFRRCHICYGIAFYFLLVLKSSLSVLLMQSGRSCRHNYSHCWLLHGQKLDAWACGKLRCWLFARPHRGSRCGGRRHGDGVRHSESHRGLLR